MDEQRRPLPHETAGTASDGSLQTRRPSCREGHTLMVVIRERPANPFLVVYHTPITLTRAVVEGFAPGRPGHPPPLVAALLRIPGVQGVQRFRYELWVRRAREVPWRTLLPAIEQALQQHWGSLDVRAWHPEPRYLTVACPGLTRASPLVFEGIETAQAHPVARALFAIEGVAEVRCQPEHIRVRKGAVFHWDDLQPQITAALARVAPGADREG
jgi:hypothetical protein